MKYCDLLLLLAFAVADPPEPPIPPIPPGTTLELGQPITVPLGKKCILTAETSAKKVTWVVPIGADAMPLDGRRLAVWATPGTYTFTAMVPSGDDVISKEIVLTVVGAIPPPIPIPVPVVDPLIAPAQEAFRNAPASLPDSDGVVHTKGADKLEMIAVFRALSNSVNDPLIKTAKHLYDVNANTMKARLQGRLGGVGTVFATDFGIIFPVQTRESYVLTQVDRDNAKARLLRYATVLEGVK